MVNTPVFANIQKLISIITLSCFILTVMSSGMYGQTLSKPVYDSDDIFDKMGVVQSNLGKITNINDSSSDITVINIQDLHCHKQTQLNISRIIKEINNKFSLESIYVEGGYGNIDTGWLDQINDDDFKDKIMEELLEEGYLSAAEYFAVTNGRHNFLKGLDSSELHNENLKRLSTVIQNQSKYKESLSGIEKELKILNSQYVNGRNKRFTKHINSYLNGKTDSVKFYTFLFKYINKINNNPQDYNNITAIKTEDYPNMSMFLGLSKEYQDLNVDVINDELSQFLSSLKGRMTYSVYKKLLEYTDNFKDTERLVEFLSRLPADFTPDISKNYTLLDKFFAIKRMNQRINPVSLMNEERSLIGQIRMALSKNVTEQEISYITDFSKYFKDYLTYSLTASDWKYFKLGFDKFYDIYAKYAVIDRIAGLKNDMKELNRYYEVNDIRNSIFVSNILKGENPVSVLSDSNVKIRTVEEILKQSKEIKIVITGGYHSEDLLELLNEKNVNTIVITPRVKSKIEQANEKYTEIVREQNKIKAQALAFRLASCSVESDQRILLAKAAMHVLGTEDIDFAKRKLMEYGIQVGDITIPESSDEAVRKEQSDGRIKKIGSLMTKIINLIISPDMILNPGETIDTALIAMFEILVIQGVYFSKGFSPYVEEADPADKQTLFKKFDAVILSRLPAVIQQGIVDLNAEETAGAVKKETALSKIEEILQKDLKDLVGELKKKSKYRLGIKKNSFIDKIILRFAPSEYMMESIDYQLKQIEAEISTKKNDIENMEIIPLAQITDMSMRESAVQNTVNMLKEFRSNLDILNQLKISLEEIRAQMTLISSKNYDYKINERLKATTEKFERAEQNFNILLNEFMNAISKVYSDENTKQHSMKVAQYTQTITKYIPEEYKKAYGPYFEYYLAIAAILHDVGKNTVPDGILNKSGNLNENEFEIMKSHAEKGAQILNASGFEMFSFGAQYHHERFDGKGYPDQLIDGQIPLIAAIISLADSYDAMISKRIYKDELYRYIAIGRIKHDEKIYFNPVVTEAFMKAVYNGEFTPLRKGEIDYLLETSMENSDMIAMPQNFEIVKESIQKGQGVWETAFRTAVKEIPNAFYDKPFKTKNEKTSAAGIKNNFSLTSKISRISGRIADAVKNIILFETSVVKQVVIDYKYIKSTGISDAVKKFGSGVSMDKNGTIHIPPVLIVKDIENIPAKERKNTGLKVKGKTIWKVEAKDMLVYGAGGALIEDISKTLGSDVVKEELERILRKSGHKINLAVDMIMTSDSQNERILFQKHITSVQSEEIETRTTAGQAEYLGAVLGIRSAIALSQGEKIIISLEKVEDRELLMQKIKNGRSRKIITETQYKKLKAKNENIDGEFMNLRKEGIDLYIKFDKGQIEEEYRQKGFSGYIFENKITDYYSGDTVNIKILNDEQNVTLKYLEEIMTSSQEPLVVNIDVLEKVFKQNRDILDSYDMLNLLIGSIETTFKIGDLTPYSAKETAYNINFEKIPEISKEKREEFAVLSDDELIDMERIKTMLNLSGNDIINITMQDIEEETVKKAFMKAVREKILAKSMLKEHNKNYGLKDKKLEIMLGRFVLEQLRSNDKTTVSIPEDFIGNEENMMKFINKLQFDIENLNASVLKETDKSEIESLYGAKAVAVNTVIELILVFADDNKFKSLDKLENDDDAKNYRAMLSAA